MLAVVLSSRGRLVRRARIWLMVWLTIPGIIAAVGSLFGWWDWLPIIALVGAIVAVGQRVVTRSVWISASSATRAAVVGAFLVAILWMIAMMQAPRLTVLAVRGEHVAATVVSDDVTHHFGRYGEYYEHCYHLRLVLGAPIPGRLCRDGNYTLDAGATIDVVVDPDGLVPPDVPDTVSEARFWQILGFASLAATPTAGWITGGLVANADTNKRPSRRARSQGGSRHRGADPAAGT